MTAQIQQEQEAEEFTQHLYAELELDLAHQIPQDQAAEASIQDLSPRPEPEECAICYEPFDSKTIKTRLPCNHFFCARCLSMQEQNTCAMCRAVF